MSETHRDAEESFAQLLSSFDDRLQRGLEPSDTVGDALDADTQKRLEEAQEFLRLVEAVWPRQGIRSSNQGASQAPVISGALCGLPQKIGRFEVCRVLGHGGGGIVYLARDPLLGREVAVKVPRLEMMLTPAMRTRFLREAKAAATLNHPNIIPTLEVGEVDELCFIVYSYCSGPTLAHWLLLSDKVSPCTVIAELVERLADAMAHAHRRGVLHRDLKPSNILLQMPDGCRGDGRVDQTALDSLRSVMPQITDFGLAKLAAETEDITRTGTILGTPGYMAPEQTLNAKELGPACDVWALGVILYELLTRQRPFQGPTPVEVTRAIREQEPISPRRLRSDVPRDLETICLKCLAKTPARRYESAFALAEDLRRFQEGGVVQARPVHVWERLWKWARQRPAHAALVGMVLMALVGSAVGIFHYVARLEDLVASANRENVLDNRVTEEQARSRRLRYVADVRAAFQAIAERNPEAAKLLLERWPDSGAADERGLEWFELKRQVANQRPWHIALPGLEIVGLEAQAKLARTMHAFTMSHDCRFAASMNDDSTIDIYDVESWQKLNTITKRQSPQRTYLALAFSADGHVLATVANRRVRDGNVLPELLLWNWSRDILLPQTVFYRQHERPAGTAEIEIHPNGKELVVRLDGVVYVHSIGDLSKESPDHDFGLHCKVVLSPNGDFLATAKVRSGRVEIRSFPHLKVRRAFAWNSNSPCQHLCFSSDSKKLVYGDQNALYFVDLEDPIPQSVVAWRDNPISAVAFSPNADLLYVGTLKGDLKVFCTKTWKLLYTETEQLVTHLTPHPDGKRLYVRTWLGGVRIVDGTWPPSPAAIDTKGGRLYAVAFSPDGSLLAAGGQGRDVCIFDPSTAKQRFKLACRSQVFALAFSLDGKILAAGGIDGIIHRWDAVSWMPLSPLDGHTGRVGSLAFTPDRRHLLSMSWDKTCRLWQLADGATAHVFHGPFNHFSGLALSPGGAEFAWVGENDPSIRIWNIANKEERVLPFVNKGRAVCYSAAGRWMATSNADGAIFLWDGQGEKQVRHIVAHAGAVRSLAFSPDGKVLASAGIDKTVKIIDAASFQELATFRGPYDELRSLAWSPDGKTLVAAGHDGRVWFWHAR